jgi:hypothetical protein
MNADQGSKEKRTADPFLDRRSGEDRRQAYDLDYFEQGGMERRMTDERRKADERRDQCVKVGKWTSVCPEKKSSAV